MSCDEPSASERYRQEYEGAYHAHADLLHGARAMLACAKVVTGGGAYLALSAALLCFFSIEGHLNYVGSQVVGDAWDEIEQKLTPRQKLVLIASLIRWSIDWGREPFQTFTALDKLRNRVAHAKPETIVWKKNDLTARPELGSIRQFPEWRESLTCEGVETWLRQTEVLMESLHRAAKLDEHDLHSITHGMAKTTRIDLPSEPHTAYAVTTEHPAPPTGDR